MLKSDAFIVTDHARVRFVERAHKYFSHLRVCRNSDGKCDQCLAQVHKLNRYISTHRSLIDAIIIQRAKMADEERGFTCDSEFMDSLMQKYGDNKFQFLVDPEVIFVVIFVQNKDDTRKLIKTCIRTETHRVGLANKQRKQFKKATPIPKLPA